MAKVSRAMRAELVSAVADRYGRASKTEKTLILDEFVAVTGYHRNHAIQILRGKRRAPPGDRRGRTPIYDEAVRRALVVLWEASDRICGKRLKPLIPVLIRAMERHGHLQLDDVVRTKLLSVSSSTIDRLLRPTRMTAKPRPTRNTPLIRNQIPVRTFADWKEPLPGFLEIDLVAHCGGNVSGSFCQTLTLTDIASGWTECVPLRVRDSSLVIEALSRLQTAMPFPLLGIDTDNGSEFVNAALLEFCHDQSIEFTRARPHRKNDQAWVEQKNGSVVRRLVGYGRLEGIAGTEALSRLYASSRLFVNFFQPSFKLLEKQRVGGKVRKRYSEPQTPCARLIASDNVGEDEKQRLRSVLVTLDPLRLLEEIRAVQEHVAGLTRGEHVRMPAHRDADLDQFLRGLDTAWRGGEVRPTHRKKPKGVRTYRTRKDPFQDVWPQVVLWLEAEPDLNAKVLLTRLESDHPGQFSSGQVRTMQRRVREWRTVMARRLLFADPPGTPTGKKPI